MLRSDLRSLHIRHYALSYTHISHEREPRGLAGLKTRYTQNKSVCRLRFGCGLLRCAPGLPAQEVTWAREAEKRETGAPSGTGADAGRGIQLYATPTPLLRATHPRPALVHGTGTPLLWPLPPLGGPRCAAAGAAPPELLLTRPARLRMPSKDVDSTRGDGVRRIGRRRRGLPPRRPSAPARLEVAATRG